MNKYLSIPVIVVCSAILGCQNVEEVNGTKVVSTHSRQPTAVIYLTAQALHLQTGSALKEVQPLKIKFKAFEDVRNTNPRDAGIHANTQVLLGTNVATILQEAVQQEFKRNGHICLTADDPKPCDFVVGGSVYKFRTELLIAKDVMHEGICAVKLMVSKAGRPEVFYIKNYEGNYSKKTWMGLNHYVPALTETTCSMLKDMTTDSKLADFLKKNDVCGRVIVIEAMVSERQRSCPHA